MFTVIIVSNNLNIRPLYIAPSIMLMNKDTDSSIVLIKLIL